MFYNVLQAAFTLMSSFILLHVISFFKVNCMIGAGTAYFSGVNIVGPLLGAWYGLAGAASILGARVVFKSIFNNMVFTPLVYHIPNICAASYWMPGKRALKIAIPAVCMILFLVHPVGIQAWFYTSFWLIPMALSLVPGRSLFLTALGSTFTAHAVGSVLWLYWIPMAPETFALLMPIVPFERLAYASGMVMIEKSRQAFWGAFKKMQVSQQYAATISR